MKVECNRCGHLATIRSSSKESENSKRLYCSCNNPQCGHSFVMDLSSSHTLSPSALDLPENFLQKLHKAGPDQQRTLFQSLAS